MLFFQRLLKQDKERLTVPKSVQQSIPIQHIWPDGIMFTGGKYSKCWRFDDINYSVASQEDKTAMFLDYSSLLNILDTGATTKITINNRSFNRDDFEQNVEDCLKSVTARTMLANSEFIVMLNQAATDRMELAKLLNISDTQLSYITNAEAGQGLLKCSSAIVPFMDRFPCDAELYKLMTTKMDERKKLNA
jgi:hypothetical protein